MKKIILAFLFVSGFALASQAQTGDQKPTPPPVAETEAAPKADAKSCCAGMTDAEKKNCKDMKKAETDQKASASSAPAATAAASCCSSKSAAKAECAGKTTAAAEPTKKEKAKKK